MEQTHDNPNTDISTNCGIDTIIKYQQSLNRPLVLDGAIGSYLESYYPQQKDTLVWVTVANEEENLLYNLYTQYLESGADVITTNTFGTFPAALCQNSTELLDKNNEIFAKSASHVKKAVEICKKIRENKELKKFLIAGSNAPAEDCYLKERKLTYEETLNSHEAHISYLVENGVDFVLNETMGHFFEIKIAVKICEEKKVPYAISLYFKDDLTLLSGESVFEVLDFIDQNCKPLFVGFNCIQAPVFTNLIEQTDFNKFSFKIGFYLNCGMVFEPEKNVDEVDKTSPTEIKNITAEVLKTLGDKVFIVGTCCLSNPEYTKAIRELFN